MNDIKKKLQEHLDYKGTYWYHKMKAYEHICKEANEKWEECWHENNMMNELKQISKNEEIISQLLEYKSFGNFHIHAHNSFEYPENSYPIEYDAIYEGVSVDSIKSFYDWLERRV